MKDHTVNKVRGIPDFAYIPFDKAYRLAENLLKSGSYATLKEFYELIGRNKTGWLGLEIKSMKVWGLVVSEKRKMKLTKQFYKISSSTDPDEKLRIKRGAFLNIPLFREVFEKYKAKELPKKTGLSKFLEEEYGINPSYSPTVAKTFIDSIHRYFKEFGKEKQISENKPIQIRKVEENLSNDLGKKNSVNIKINSPIGNFNLEATNKEEFEKVMRIISVLWDKKGDIDEDQVEGAHET